MDNSELKPCPHCGKKVTAKRSKSGKMWWIVCPDNSPCFDSGMAVVIKAETESKGIAAWNSRVPTSPQED